MGYQGAFRFERGGQIFVDAWSAERNHFGDGYWLWIDVRTEENHERIMIAAQALIEIAYRQATAGNEERLRDELGAAAAALAEIPQEREPRLLLADKEAIVDHFVRRRTEAARSHIEYLLDMPL